MRPTFAAVTSVVLCLAAGQPAGADGLIYQLPQDGAWVRYELEARGPAKDGQEQAQVIMQGTLTISTVGAVVVDGEQCRWIEVVVDAKQGGRAFTEIDKVLIPEQQIGRGKQPQAYVAALWHMHSSLHEAPRQISSFGERFQTGRPLHFVLHAPFENQKKLEPITIKGILGELPCEGILVSEAEKHDRSNIEHQSSYEIRLHPSVPFGAAAWKASYVTSRDGQLLNTWTLTGTLQGVGKDAKSQLDVPATGAEAATPSDQDASQG